MPRRNRAKYNPVSSNDTEGLSAIPSAEGDETITGIQDETNLVSPTEHTSMLHNDNNTPTQTTSSTMGGINFTSRSIRQTSAQNLASLQEIIATNKSDSAEGVADLNTTVSTPSLVDTMEIQESVSSSGSTNSSSDDIEGKDIVIHEKITVVILDAAQKRFSIDVDPSWTVETFKKVGKNVHKIAPQSQRLIFRGRMLDDSKTLRDMGIYEDDVIIHLFPKPRVKVVTDSSRSDGSSIENDENNSGGAHVPEIILDEAEQERRGQILVLGSHEIAEAQNNVRLLSLLLGTISFMRLLALLSIASGTDEVPVYQDDLVPPGNSTDDSIYPHYDYEPRTWQNQDYFDLVVSVTGFLVARLGMKATQENTSRLAFQYLTGTLIAGILWNLWNIFEFVLFVKDESQPKDDDKQEQLTNDDFRTIAIFTVMLPMFVWFLCCARAWQFQHLISEAEVEAADRIRSELNLSDETNNDNVAREGEQELDDLSTSNRREIV